MEVSVVTKTIQRIGREYEGGDLCDSNIRPCFEQISGKSSVDVFSAATW